MSHWKDKFYFPQTFKNVIRLYEIMNQKNQEDEKYIDSPEAEELIRELNNIPDELLDDDYIAKSESKEEMKEKIQGWIKRNSYMHDISGKMMVYPDDLLKFLETL